MHASGDFWKWTQSTISQTTYIKLAVKRRATHLSSDKDQDKESQLNNFKGQELLGFLLQRAAQDVRRSIDTSALNTDDGIVELINLLHLLFSRILLQQSTVLLDILLDIGKAVEKHLLYLS